MITSDRAGSVPKYLFRYLRDDDRLIETLTTPYLWFSDPGDLNDPFDLTNVFELNSSVDDILWYLGKYAHFDWDREPEVKRLIELGDTSVAEAMARISEALHTTYLARIGVCCFSFRRDSPLMWSHYSAGHSGVCLVIKALSLVMNYSLIEVQYGNKLPKWDLMKNRRLFGESMRYNRNFDQVVLGTKYDDWAYEEEYRLISRTRGRNQLDRESVAGVILGARMSQGRRDEIVANVASSNPEIPFVRAQLVQATGSLSVPGFTNEKRLMSITGWRMLTDREGQLRPVQRDALAPESYLFTLKELPYPDGKFEVGGRPMVKIHRGGSSTNPGSTVAAVRGLITDKGLDLPSNTLLFNVNPATGDYMGAQNLSVYLVAPDGRELYAFSFDITPGKPNPLIGY